MKPYAPPSVEDAIAILQDEPREIVLLLAMLMSRCDFDVDLFREFWAECPCEKCWGYLINQIALATHERCPPPYEGTLPRLVQGKRIRIWLSEEAPL